MIDIEEAKMLNLSMNDKMLNSVTLIDGYAQERHNGRVRCIVDPIRGRCLFS